MPGSGYVNVYYDPTQGNNLSDLPPLTRFNPGEIVRHRGKTYMYVVHHQGVGTVASAAGMPAYWRDRDNYVVTPDKTDNLYGAALAEGVAGIYQAIVTHLNGTFIQVGGVAAGVVATNAGAVGAHVFPPASDVNNTLDNVAVASMTAAQAASQLVGIQKTARATDNTIQLDLRLHLQD